MVQQEAQLDRATHQDAPGAIAKQLAFKAKAGIKGQHAGQRAAGQGRDGDVGGVVMVGTHSAGKWSIGGAKGSKLFRVP